MITAHFRGLVNGYIDCTKRSKVKIAEYGKSATVTDSITITTCTTPTIPVPTIPVKSAVTTCTAPTVPIPDYKIDEFLDRQNQIIAPQFQDEC